MLLYYKIISKANLFWMVSCRLRDRKIQKSLQHFFCLFHCKEFQLIVKEEIGRIIWDKKSKFVFLYIRFKMWIRYTHGDIERIDVFI